MFKIFACVFPYSKIPAKLQKDDISNQGFLQDQSNSSICELSYHHVDSVSRKCLQERIQKLEQEKAALIEIMISQHKSKYEEKLKDKKEKRTSNYYKKHFNKFKKDENTYDYISID
ncbi:uncharacterized protein CELE_Y19D2B.2 [Caenorhabditis elegans]|uniref:Uncharacterized protein n=1 Tax=Caenorhabditis elegans TaxID=6239 RepID=G5EDC8_CAEEL|nr:Uncharacterized protein CELE_Y19D2B.2 [Caenorhabditis elegans]CAE17976.2 Uncharacterized protein CELE_Y19D2B.2 [Caenorhabditis elegans]